MLGRQNNLMIKGSAKLNDVHAINLQSSRGQLVNITPYFILGK